MSAIDSTTSRSIFGPNKKDTRESGKVGSPGLKRNTDARKSDLDSLSNAVSKVFIVDAFNDFSRIKKAGDAAP